MSKRKDNTEGNILDKALTVVAVLLLTMFVVISLQGIANAGSVTLQWDANTEPDLAGYKVYYGTASRSYGEPISLDLVTEYTMHIPDSVEYFFAVTAFDTEALESDFSNEVSCINNDKPIIIELHIICN